MFKYPPNFLLFYLKMKFFAPAFKIKTRAKVYQLFKFGAKFKAFGLRTEVWDHFDRFQEF
ncbi:hypothetical protein B10460_02760 [Campylobacter coli]|nr:hypothetical protein CCO1610 [Campylobacter coli RM2228]BEJ68672.1 hypothetical protein B10307_16230 [Campylobacter coli]BEJ72240.1 hypothetical protein B10328_14770 [Campylobacter coli]BEJ81204.1 hypothetical protein B10420_14860 [Campylobacter coli]BEJ81706.1 hypothetical protein B10460_02760 [Campylobacter coli]